jgi:hypothetical protein
MRASLSPPLQGGHTFTRVVVKRSTVLDYTAAITRPVALNAPDVIDRELMMVVRLHTPKVVHALLQDARVMLREHIPHVVPAILPRAPSLSMDAASARGNVALLDLWRSQHARPAYSAAAIDSASKSGHVAVLDWWLRSGLELKYREWALDGASGGGHDAVLDWWVKVRARAQAHRVGHGQRQRKGPRCCPRLVGQVRARAQVLGGGHRLCQQVRRPNTSCTPHEEEAC